MKAGTTADKLKPPLRGFTHQKYEDEAAKWEETGQFDYFSKGRYSFVRMHLWLDSRGARFEGVNERLQRYYWALKEELKPESWYDDFLNERDICRECGESFSYENLSFCTFCEANYGYCHKPGGFGTNGNPVCPLCGKGEIVG